MILCLRYGCMLAIKLKNGWYDIKTLHKTLKKATVKANMMILATAQEMMGSSVKTLRSALHLMHNLEIFYKLLQNS